MRRVDQSRAFAQRLIAIAAVAAVAACGSSGSKPPTASQAVTTTRLTPPAMFASQRYGFSVTLTADWSEHDARVDWNGKKLQGLNSAAFANFTDPTTGRTLAVGASPVAKRTGLANWRAAMVRAAPDVCSEARSAEHTTLGGEPGLAWTSTCSDGYNVIKVRHEALPVCAGCKTLPPGCRGSPVKLRTV
jgi:hypothetical protein